MSLQKLLPITKNVEALQRMVAGRSIRFAQKGKKHQVPRKLEKVFVGSSFMIMGIWGLSKKSPDKEPLISTREVLLAKADALFDQGKYKEIYDLLTNYRDSRDVDILWRLSRALYNMSKTANEVEAKKMIYEGYDLISAALNIKDDNWAVHKWMSILLNSKCSYDGMRVTIKELPNIKKHMLRANELNPSDATTLYMLGTWCYQVSDLAWYQRKIAAAIFGNPPTSSFEEALMYFENAEKTDPNFYSHNLLMLGKTYLKLNQKDEALVYLRKTAEFLARNDDDQKAKQEALKLLNSI